MEIKKLRYFPKRHNSSDLFIPKEDQPASSRDLNPLQTIWIIVDETTYKDPAPKTLVELRQWLPLARKSVTSDALWELLHSIPHRLEMSENIQEDILFTNILVI